MGSLDWGFVSSALSLKPAEIDQLGVDETYLVDKEAVGCFRFIQTYLHETGSIPDPSIVKEKYPSFVFDDAVHPKWVAKELRERKLFNIVADGLRVAASDLREGTPLDVLETLERIRRNAEAVNQQVSVHDLQKMGESLKQFYEDIKGGRRGIEFPWESINLLTRGMWPETVTFFAARPGTGKTFLAIIIARYAHMMSKRPLIVSPEMNAMELGERFFAIEAGVSYSDVISGSLSQVKGEDGRSAEDLYFESMKGTGSGPFIIDDEERLTPEAMEATISALEPDLLAVDAAYLLKIGKGSRYERIIDVVEWLRHVAKKFHIPVLATSQLTKEAEKKGAIGQLSVALTDTINWDAHNLFALKQTPEMREDGRLSIVPIKVRRMAKMHGKSEIDIHWDMDRMDFDEIEDDKGEFKDEGYKEFAGASDSMPF
jgi:hypothetical protein